MARTEDGCPMSLDEKAFAVLGAGQGIGAATARAIAALGGRTVCVDRDPVLAEQIASETGGIWVCADVEDEGEVLQMLDAAEEQVGPLFGAVDVVGRATRRSIPELDPAAWQAEFDLNLRHAYLLGRALAPRMAARRAGSLVFIASSIAGAGCHVTPGYHAAKAALISWMKSIAVTFGPAGVRANAVAPGPTLTPRMSAQWDVETRRGLEARTALKALAEPEDIASAATFLLSPAARMISGHVLVVDGGANVRDPYYGDTRDASFADDIDLEIKPPISGTTTDDLDSSTGRSR